MKDVKDLTKEDRLKVYREARKIYKHEITLCSNDELPGMCWCIIKAASNLRFIDFIDFSPKTLMLMHSVHNLVLLKQCWPEFAALRPKNADSYWWPREDTESRLKAFDELCKI
jgi:hypothetical protein